VGTDLTQSPDLIRAQLNKILASKLFRASELQKQFLGFIVLNTLEGRSSQIKEYSIGADAFDRGPDFDPRVDSVVRVVARRVRDKLAEYYRYEGKSDSLVIQLSTGSYIPSFSCSAQARVPALAPVSPSPASQPATAADELVGATVSHYEVLELIARGSSGIVYRAEDLRLNRGVALKVLFPELASDARQLERCLAEARSASAVNHPNVCAIYDVGEYRGRGYIVMELVEGKTLDRFIDGKPLAVQTLLDLGIQISEALAAAHSRGIVHRDVRSANIMVNNECRAKLLDFSAAQAIHQAVPGKAAAAIARSQGAFGSVVGVESPQDLPASQARETADIVGMGAILYEMATAQRFSAGANPSPQLLNPAIPSALDQLIQAAIAMDPGLKGVSDVRYELLRLKQARHQAVIDVASVSGARDLRPGELADPAGLESPALPEAGKSPRSHWMLSVSLGLTAVAVLMSVILFVSRWRQPQPSFNTTMTISRLATRGEPTTAAISSDGKYVAYVLPQEGGESIWTTQLATGSDLRVLGPEAGVHLGMKFSPDGSYLYYRLNTSTGAHNLYRVPALGGTPVKLMDDVPGTIAFAPDGKHLAVVRIDPLRFEAALTVANADGSDPRIVRTRRRPEYFSRHGIAWSPDGTAIACFAGNVTGFSPQAFRLVSVRVSDGTETILSPESWAWVDSMAWSPNGTIAVDASRERQDALQLWLVTPSRRGIARITNDLSRYRRITLSSDGSTLAALETRRDIDLWVTPLGAPETAARIVSENLRGLNSVAWTVDGRILFSALNGRWRDIWAVNPDGSNQHLISSGSMDKQELAVTRDGRYILYSARGSIWRMDIDGSNPVQLTQGFWDVHPASSADSQFVVYTSFRNRSPGILGKPTLWQVPVGGGKPSQITNEAASLPEVSPDGTRIACNYYPGPNPEYSSSPMAIFSAATGRPLQVFENTSRPLQLFENTSLGDTPVSWTPDGKALLYRVKAHGIGNLWRQPLAGGPPVPVTDFRSGDLFDYAFSKDFKTVALARGKETNDVVLISGFR